MYFQKKRSINLSRKKEPVNTALAGKLSFGDVWIPQGGSLARLSPASLGSSPQSNRSLSHPINLPFIFQVLPVLPLSSLLHLQWLVSNYWARVPQRRRPTCDLLHPGKRAAIGATVCIVLIPVAAHAALGLVGFSAAGPVAGMSHAPPTELHVKQHPKLSTL
jgi:hypothetical protein